jgi:NADPH-dependent ferric siderophore reductase
MRRIVLAGTELTGFELDAPGASVRLLVPSNRADPVAIPVWTGNQYELEPGRRAAIRTFTPRRFDAAQLELTIDVVLHGAGVASDWAAVAEPGDEAAMSGPGRGYEIDAGARSFLLAGDESAIPAISQLLEAIPAHVAVTVDVEIADEEARLALPDHPGASVTWHVTPLGEPPGGAFASAVESLAELPELIWVAGEAAAVQRVRRHLFEARGLPRERVTARGYWKHGRAET